MMSKIAHAALVTVCTLATVSVAGAQASIEVVGLDGRTALAARWIRQVIALQVKQLP